MKKTKLIPTYYEYPLQPSALARAWNNIRPHRSFTKVYRSKQGEIAMV